MKPKYKVGDILLYVPDKSIHLILKADSYKDIRRDFPMYRLEDIKNYFSYPDFVEDIDNDKNYQLYGQSRIMKILYGEI